MTNNVILGIPFIFMLYPFKAELDGVYTVRMGVPVKFHFASRFKIDVFQLSMNLILAKTPVRMLSCLDIPLTIFLKLLRPMLLKLALEVF